MICRNNIKIAYHRKFHLLKVTKFCRREILTNKV